MRESTNRMRESTNRMRESSNRMRESTNRMCENTLDLSGTGFGSAEDYGEFGNAFC